MPLKKIKFIDRNNNELKYFLMLRCYIFRGASDKIKKSAD